MIFELGCDGVGKRSRKRASSSRSAGRGQLSPAALARCRYSLTVLWEMEQLRAMARFFSPHSHFRRRTSRILRMVNLSWVTSASFVFWRQECHKTVRLASAACYSFKYAPRFRSMASTQSSAWRPPIPASRKNGRHATGTRGRHGPERVDGIHRNHRSAWPGLRI